MSIEAISWYARKLGTSYGKLVPTLTEKDEERISEEYKKHRRERERQLRAEAKERVKVRGKIQHPGY